MTPRTTQPRTQPKPQPRLQTEVYRDQLAAIGSWNAARRAEEARARAAETSTASREQRLDLTRRMDVLRREHEALIRRTDEQLRESVALLQATAPRRAVVAHRNAWFTRTVTDALTEGGFTVVAQPANGADAVGVVVAEQPDLVLIAGVLPMISGVQVIREVRTFAPRALVAAQAENDGQVGTLLEAGAAIAFTRRVSPVEVSRELCQLL